jgi:hypothetical protein
MSKCASVCVCVHVWLVFRLCAREWEENVEGSLEAWDNCVCVFEPCVWKRSLDKRISRTKVLKK